METRPARESEYDAVTAILDGAMLETIPERTRESIASGQTFVAIEGGRILGTAVCVPPETDEGDEGIRIDAIAVRRRRRGQGIGRALVDAIQQKYGRVVAHFDEQMRPFYESLDFDIERVRDGRFRGVQT